MAHINLTVGQHIYRAPASAADGMHAEFIATEQSEDHINGSASTNVRRSIAMIMVESTFSETAKNVVTGIVANVLPLISNVEAERRSACEKLEGLGARLSDGQLHASLIVVRWPMCHVLYIGSNRHLLVRGNATQVMTPLPEGRARSVSVELKNGDWVLMLTNRTRQCMPLSSENKAINRLGIPGSVCREIVRSATCDDPNSDHVVMALFAEVSA